MSFWSRLFAGKENSAGMTGQPLIVGPVNVERAPRLHARRDRLRIAIAQGEGSGIADHLLEPHRRELADINRELGNG